MSTNVLNNYVTPALLTRMQRFFEDERYRIAKKIEFGLDCGDAFNNPPPRPSLDPLISCHATKSTLDKSES